MWNLEVKTNGQTNQKQTHSSILSDMSIATPAFFSCPFAWKICFQPFTFSLCKSFVLRWVSWPTRFLMAPVTVTVPKRRFSLPRFRLTRRQTPGQHLSKACKHIQSCGTTRTNFCTWAGWKPSEPLSVLQDTDTGETGTMLVIYSVSSWPADLGPKPQFSQATVNKHQRRSSACSLLSLM